MFNFGLNTDLLSRIFTPRRKRKPLFIAFARVMLSPISYLHRRVFTYFYYTQVYPIWNSVTSYNIGSVVRFGYQVFESRTNGNLNNQPNQSTQWMRIQDNWIGGFVRSNVKPGKIALEKYLNDFFETDFNYPASANDIYIETNDEDVTQFTVGSSDLNTAQVSSAVESTIYFVSDTFTTYSQNSFTVYIPTAKWTAIESTDAKREGLVKGILDNYVPAGIQYNVTDY